MNGNVAIIGMPCSGKSSVGKIVAERIGATHIDTDELIEHKTGMTVSEIFDKFGENKFRELESEAILTAASTLGAVISCGGGAVMRKENLEALKNCTVVYLRVSEETVLDNLGSDESRPLLRGDAVKNVHTIMKERSRLYERAANVIVDADGMTAAEVADAVMEALQKARE